MAVTENVFLPIGDPGGPSSGQTQFTINFEYLQESDVKVSLDGIDTTAYTFANATTIQFNTAPADGVIVRIYRDTNIDTAAAVFAAGSVIRAQDLNNDFDQIRFVVQELDNNNWDNEVDTIKTTNTWVSDNDHVATTAAIDARFQDEIGDTIDSNEAWISDDDHIASTAAIDGRIDEAITNDIAGSDGISITDDGDGTITVGISANSVDLDRIKDEDIITYAEQEAGNSWLSDTRIPTTFAAARRFDTLVQPTTPTGSTWAVGKTWLQNDQDLTVSVWNGSAWLAVASGGAFTNQPKVVYVDATAGDDGNDGHRISRPKQTIKAAIAQINADATYGDGSVVVVAPGIYQEVAPIDITKKDVSIIGTALRSCIVHPTPATETNSLFRVNSGTFLQNLTFTGVKASGVRGGVGSVDPDATYGLPVTQGWNVSFYPGAMIYKSPYIQNCTNFSDSEINNANLNAHTPAGGSAGDTDSAVTGGGLLVDGAVVDSSSPLRSMVCDSYTHVGLDGPGILVTNNGYAQCTSSYAFFNHYHIKCLNGGQANLAASTTDFGRYGLIADGRSTSAIFTATTTADAADQDITFTIDAPVAGANWHGSATRPQSNMLVDIGGNTYPVLSATANGAGWDVTISRPDPTNTADNLGLNGAVLTGAAVSFYLRSMVASSGHTMEYAGSGTNYSALPENGGVPIEANQVLELNDGKVWTAITDHNGKFKLGNFFTVDQQTSTVSVQTGSFAVSLQNLQVNPGGNAVIGANLDLNGSSILDSTGNVTIADVLSMSNNKIVDVGGPTNATDAANKGYVDGYAVAKAGDTMTGQLKLVGDPVADEDAARKKYVDDTVSASVAAADEWVRAGTTISPKTAGDVVEFSAGTAALPGLTPVGDPDTGIYSPGADQLALSTNGTGRLFIDSSGLVGVGASNPGELLHLKGTGATTSIKIEPNSSSTIFTRIKGLNGDLYLEADPGNAENSTGLIFTVDGSERARIDSSGRLGIGVSGPSYLIDASTATGTTTVGDGTVLRLVSSTTDGDCNIRFGSGTNATARLGVNGTDLYAYVNGAERMRLTSTGLGIGSTPSFPFHVTNSSNAVIACTNPTDSATGVLNAAGGGTINVGTASNHPLTVSINSTEAFRVDTSRRLLVGTSSSSAEAKFIVQGGATASGGGMNIQRNVTTASAGSTIGFIHFTNSANNVGAGISAAGDGTWSAGTSHPTLLAFSTTADGASSPTERMRINNVGITGVCSGSGAGTSLYVSSPESAGTSNYLIQGRHSGGILSGTQSFRVYTNGNVENTNNSYGAISDIKLKENIVDANSQWDDIKALQVRNYNFKEGQTHTQIGLIAQEVELVSPGLVSESPDRDEDGNDLGTVTKSVNYSVLYMKAVKALQEAMERIETLEAKVAALETQ